MLSWKVTTTTTTTTTTRFGKWCQAKLWCYYYWLDRGQLSSYLLQTHYFETTHPQTTQENNKGNGTPSTVYFWSFQTKPIVYMLYFILFWRHVYLQFTSRIHMDGPSFLSLNNTPICKRCASNGLLRCDDGSQKHATIRWVTRQVSRLRDDNIEYFNTHSYDMLQLTLVRHLSTKILKKKQNLESNKNLC